MSYWPRGGYTCAFCSTWVPDGAVHLCGHGNPAATVIELGPAAQALFERIAAALERIADRTDQR